ncbi:MAG: phosphoribosylamine--glycine ligase [Saezia sp.]
MKVLVIGSGGREHALAWKLAQSPIVREVFVAPGNGGTQTEPKVKNLALTDFSELADFCVAQKIELTVVGPDAALAEGVVNLFQDRGLAIFGPTKEAAEIEWSKDFSKAFMTRHKIPTAKYQSFTDAQAAHAYVNENGAPIVIKADGLAAGKGVVVAMTLEQAHTAIDEMLVDKRFGASGQCIVIEEFMQGEEASFFVLTDGYEFVILSSAQDHKRLNDGDEGPNTGGMGAYAPAPIVTPDMRAKVLREVVRPTLKGMAMEGRPFCGFLYIGLMIDAEGGVRVVEYNSRMGDPEAQPIMMRIKSDFAPLLLKAAQGKLEADVELEWDRRSALTVIMASHGYPDSPRVGDVIHGLPLKNADVKVFHAGTKLEGGVLTANGGRVLCVTALADTLKVAKQIAYDAVTQIRFEGMQYRKDIGDKGIARSHHAHD